MYLQLQFMYYKYKYNYNYKYINIVLQHTSECDINPKGITVQIYILCALLIFIFFSSDQLMSQCCMRCFHTIMSKVIIYTFITYCFILYIIIIIIHNYKL